MKCIRFHKKVANRGGGLAMTGFLLILFLLLGKSIMSYGRNAIDPNSPQSVGQVYGPGHIVHPAADLPFLLEETDDSFRYRSKHSPTQIGTLIDLHKFFTTYCWSTYKKGRIINPSFAIYPPPRYILFHTLFIPC